MGTWSGINVNEHCTDFRAVLSMYVYIESIYWLSSRLTLLLASLITELRSPYVTCIDLGHIIVNTLASAITETGSVPHNNFLKHRIMGVACFRHCWTFMLNASIFFCIKTLNSQEQHFISHSAHLLHSQEPSHYVRWWPWHLRLLVCVQLLLQWLCACITFMKSDNWTTLYINQWKTSYSWI